LPWYGISKMLNRFQEDLIITAGIASGHFSDFYFAIIHYQV
jgi:hypothetical protein